jgi:hypothetical protein
MCDQCAEITKANYGKRVGRMLPLTCADCGDHGAHVTTRRLWGQGSDTPLCPDCWAKTRTD